MPQGTGGGILSRSWWPETLGHVTNLGDILSRRLGGTWVLRQKMEESQVRVGKRVWLPFLRARRYMQSRESLLVYSLTQFFHDVARYRL
ncbi:hypothetical protein [Myxococcus xanthus]|uniref:hypothetical protein n=1 Tax=Myxococcus xanthus TaxID=34 RepID=UPI00112622B5|nr:hypothetical protein [Myxococcus xanthus]